ncbi:MAG: hypothetical protein M3383_06280 [Actinomycetota bacterium]|nr:hypothetical protein [Actinomycetota bacterium]
MRRDWWMPLTGIAFVVLLIVGWTIGGEPPDVESPVEEIVDFYVDDKDSIVLGLMVGGLGLLALLFFANHLRRVFSAAGEAPFAPLVLVGAAIMAVGGAVDATIMLALAESVEDIEPSAVQSLQALWDNDFIPIALGAITFLLTSGISILQTRSLPSWLGWIAILLALLGATPIGYFSFPAGGLWIIVVSVMLAVRARRAPGPGVDDPRAGRVGGVS